LLTRNFRAAEADLLISLQTSSSSILVHGEHLDAPHRVTAGMNFR
jgi:hypothetical protein